MNSDDTLIRGLSSRIHELCDARDVDKAISVFSKARQLCLPNSPLYNGILAAHSHLTATIKAYVHFVLDPFCRFRPPKSKIVTYMEYAGMTISDLTGPESQTLQTI